MIPILQVGDILVSPDIFTEHFCCDLDACKGACCIEGDAGAPVTMEEVAALEGVLDDVWEHLSASAQAVLDKQGVAYTDPTGDLVTSIVNGKDCVFTCYDKNGCCLCATERLYREGRTKWSKPLSCALYPIREKLFADGSIALNYDRWDICRPARDKGNALGLPLYQFLKAPLIARFGEEWYNELCLVAKELEEQGLLSKQ